MNTNKFDNKSEIELQTEYNEFIKTKNGKKWKAKWQKNLNSDIVGDFSDYLYDFYPERLA